MFNRRRRLATALVAGLVMTTACSGERPTLLDEGLDDAEAQASFGDGSGDGGGSSPVERDGPTELPPVGEAPPALVTPTGVLVPVVGRGESGYVVLSPCGNETELAWGQPVDTVDVVLDPGHGGATEEGAIGPSGETEAEVNLDLAWRTAAQLEARGFTVALTRTSDYRVPITIRAAIADRLQAKAFVSIHHNSPSPDLTEERTQPGTEVYIQSGSDSSQRLGGLLYGDVVAALEVFDAQWASRPDAGVLVVLSEDGDDFYGVTRYPEVPAVLIELAYLANPTEALVIGTDEYRDAASLALASGIERYLTTEETGSGFIEQPRLANPVENTGSIEGCVDPALE